MAVAGKNDCGLPLPLLASSEGARLRRRGVENGLVGGFDGTAGARMELLVDITKE